MKLTINYLKLPPPITDVIITLTEKEAEALSRILGKLSCSRIEDLIGREEQFEYIYSVTSNLYWNLSDKGLG